MNDYVSTKSPSAAWDYIVIGSGMGGMTAAAFLSQLGRRVLVLEAHYVPGGFTHTFRRKRWVWDVGVHAVGEVTERSLVGRFLHRVSGGRVSWTSLGSVYDTFHFPEGFRIAFPDSRAAFRDTLHAAFPAERGAVDAYMTAVRQTSKGMRSYYLSRTLPHRVAWLTDRIFARQAQRQLTTPTQAALAQLTDNPKLSAVLAAQWGYYGSPPSRSAFAIHALVAKHFWYGGYYPQGGAKAIANGLLATVAEAGGHTRIKATVEEILCDARGARGVRLRGGEEIRAKRVISGAGALTTVSHLLPEPQRRQVWARSIGRLQPSPAYVCLYIGFKGDIRSAGASAANSWFYETWDLETGVWTFSDPQARAPILYVSFPSLKDPATDPASQAFHTGEVVTFVPFDAFAPWQNTRWKARGADYDALKEELSARLLAQLLEHMPALRPHVAFCELSTPLSTVYFTGATRGAIYGLEATPARYANPYLRPRTPVKNLFLAGCDVVSVGVIGAMMGGIIACVSAEPRRATAYLREVF